MAARWQLIPAGLAIVASTYGLARYAYGLFLPEIQADLGLTATAAGAIAAASYAGYLIATLVGSASSGITGPRLPVVLGGAAATVGMALISVADNAWSLTLGVLIAGASPGLAYPPLSDAVLRLVDESQQSRSYAVINSGTSLGVILAGPLALWAGADWRIAWMVFACFALLATFWNGWLLPTGPYGGSKEALPRLRLSWFLREGAVPLFVSASVFGSVTSIYWTFAVDFLSDETTLSDFMVTLFWVVIGIAGFAGATAGDLVGRFGIKRVFRLASFAVPTAVLLLLIAPGAIPTVLASGALFGGAFILITGLFGIWAMHVFQDRPSAGFGATFFLISAGQMIAPPIGGLWVDLFGLPSMFLVTAVVSAAGAFLEPKKDLRSILTSS